MKTSSTEWFINNQQLFLTVWRLSFRTMVLSDSVSVRTHFLIEEGALWVSFIKAPIPLTRAKPQRLHLLTASPWGLSFNAGTMGETHTRSVPEPVLITYAAVQVQQSPLELIVMNVSMESESQKSLGKRPRRCF